MGMANPQQPELRRSGLGATVEGSAKVQIQTEGDAGSESTSAGPVPEESRPGHHPEVDQDKPDIDDFARRLGARPESDPES